MSSRKHKWIVHENKNGTWDLSRGGRYLYTGLSSRGQCLARLRNYFRDGETVVLEEPDGYRTNVTSQWKRLQGR